MSHKSIYEFCIAVDTRFALLSPGTLLASSHPSCSIASKLQPSTRGNQETGFERNVYIKRLLKYFYHHPCSSWSVWSSSRENACAARVIYAHCCAVSHSENVRALRWLKTTLNSYALRYNVSSILSLLTTSQSRNCMPASFPRCLGHTVRLFFFLWRTD